MSRLPNTSYRFVTADYLDAKFRPFKHRIPFPKIKDSRIWSRWRRNLIKALSKIFALNKLGKIPTPTPKILKSEDCGTYIRHLIGYETLPGNWVRAFLLLPKTRNMKKPAVICPHGHFEGGAEAVIKPELAMGVAYAHEFAKRGVVALAPDNAGNGARDVAKSKSTRGCDLVWRRLNHVGLDLTGFRVFELMAGVSLLQAHKEVDARRIGAAGLSGGCWLSQVLTALDDRIKAVILSGYFSTFEQTAWVGHCICHHPKGIKLICEMYDIAALIAPRPLFVESGIQDINYPIEPAFSLTREAYRLLNAELNIKLHRYKGGHAFHGKRSIPWLVKQLT
ncbi:MAG: acetylxylan esterase [Planctomycetes bacterium]|nr:acetylxylan esterase [Planctomycetota bacterium]